MSLQVLDENWLHSNLVEINKEEERYIEGQLLEESSTHCHQWEKKLIFVNHFDHFKHYDSFLLYIFTLNSWWKSYSRIIYIYNKYYMKIKSHDNRCIINKILQHISAYNLWISCFTQDYHRLAFLKNKRGGSVPTRWPYWRTMTENDNNTKKNVTFPNHW